MNRRIGIHYLEQLTSAFTIQPPSRSQCVSLSVSWIVGDTELQSLDPQVFFGAAVLTRRIQRGYPY